MAFGLQLTRRAWLATATAGCAATGCTRLPAFASDADGDDMALASAARQLDTALANWDAEIALIQLGRQGALQSTANLLQEDALKRLGAGAAGASFTKHKNKMCATSPGCPSVERAHPAHELYAPGCSARSSCFVLPLPGSPSTRMPYSAPQPASPGLTVRRALIHAHAFCARRLTFLFLVTGAIKYEGAEKAAEYASDAKKEALAARAALEEVASAVGVVLSAPKPRDTAAAASSSS